MKTIKIHRKEQTINLDAKTYKIDLLGGWGVKMGEFSISIENVETNEVIYARRTKWPVQSYKKGKRSKIILSFDVPINGEYRRIFHNPETLIVKKSNLLITSFFKHPIEIQNIEIYIN